MKKYVIVGGSKGIGKETAELLAAEGHQVTVFSRTPYEGPAHTIEWEEFDVLEDSWEDQMPEDIDGLVYSVGSINLKPFRGLKTEVFEADFQLHVMGAIKALQAAYKNFNANSIPSVVLYSTVAVQRGMPFHATVSASKGAIEGLTRAIASEWAPKARINCIAPSLTDTPLAGKLLSTPEKKEAMGNNNPMKRVGEANDIAEMTAFLLSDKSSWMTGQIVHIDGGQSVL
ncbi:MAG: SDR family NAD(P)-dependent oxidoreductase [Bacteroidetes bacterium]|nr:MAG: SDR family NAD(P)-dependent oxidoreductase [Bacteroidota bacterium]REK50838.1 MAG: SDR family NAD(P)-dependent oxidoreductase [Bacteroidota bacterium]